MTILGYARVSTSHQSVGMQIQALKDAGAERIWSEQASGRRDDRPQLAALLSSAGAGDVLMVWRLDRLGRRRQVDDGAGPRRPPRALAEHAEGRPRDHRRLPPEQR